MKKILLASTAIVGGALMASPAAMAGNVTSKDTFNVSLSGIMRQMIGWYDYDQSTGRGRGYGFSAPFSEVDVDIKAKADNGITYGARFEIRDESGGGGGFAMDEHYLYMDSDSWGRVEMGAQDGVGDRMNVSGANATVATASLAGGLGSRQFYGAGIGAANVVSRWDSLITASGDDVKLIYFSPRFSGFQLGASLTPTLSNAGRGQLAEGPIENLYELGANYVGKFGDFGVTVSGTYQAGDASTPSTTEDHEVWQVGALVSFAGFEVGAGYQDQTDSGQARGTGADSGTLWNVGVGYKTGPWGVSVGYHYGERDVSTTTDADVSMVVLGGQYAVAPGWTAMLEYNKMDVDNGANTPDNDRQSLVFTNQFAF